MPLPAPHSSLTSLVPPLSDLTDRVGLGLSKTEAHVLSLLVTSSYVGSIYLSDLLARSDNPRRRARRDEATKRVQRGESEHDSLEQSSGQGSAPEWKNQVEVDPPVPIVAEGLSTDSPAPPDEDDETATHIDPDVPKWGERDHPATIKRRIKAVCIATGLSLSTVWWTVRRVLLLSPTPGQSGWRGSLSHTGVLLGLVLPPNPAPSRAFNHGARPLFLASLSASALPYLLAPTLLLGPLYAMYLDQDLPFQGFSQDGVRGRIRRFINGWSLVDWRNYVVGPITEELTFRSSILALAILSRQSSRALVFGTPLWFGVAHAHHAWEVYKKGGRSKQAAIRALLGCAFQLTYTTLFGWFASYTFVRTGSVLPATVSHIFCNAMGIYLPTTAIERYPSRKRSILAAYLAGVAGFIWGLRRI